MALQLAMQVGGSFDLTGFFYLYSPAALAVEPPCYYREVSTRALRLAIKRHLAMDKIDFTKLRYALRVPVRLGVYSFERS